MVGNSSSVMELEEEAEGNNLGTKNYRFKKIGEPVPIKPDVDAEFDPQCPPSQPLAVSEQFRLLFVAHSTGFCVARTKDVIELAKEEGSSSSIQELSIVDIPIGKVSILALSADSSTLAASIAGDLHFFSVTALLNKEQKPSFSCSLNDSSCVKDMRWTTKLEKYYLVLSSNGMLNYGAGQDPLIDVMDNVDAVEWSVKGNFVAVARKNVLRILSSKFKEKFSMLLSFKSLIGDADVSCIIKVDSIRWVRPDCIIIGCFQLADDGKVENYLVKVITSKDGKITNASSTPIVLSFNDVFLGFIDDTVPFGSGPHMFLSYLDRCELAFIANRKNMDQHIVLVGWSLDDGKNEAAIIEILNDAWLPRIDSQGNGDDNLILGLSVDKVSHDEKVKLILGEEEREISPCCILLCLTVDAKLTMFHFASAAGASVPPEACFPVSDGEKDTPPEVHSEYGLSKISSVEQIVEQVILGLQLEEVKGNELDTKRGDEILMEKDQQPPAAHNPLMGTLDANIKSHDKPDQQPPAAHKPLMGTLDANIKSHDKPSTGNEEVKHLVYAETFKGNEQQKFPVVKLNQDREDRQPHFSGKQGTNSEMSLLLTSQLESYRPVVTDFSETETRNLAEIRSSANSLSGNIFADMSNQSIHSDSQKGIQLGMELPGKKGSTSLRSASSQSRSSRKVISSKTSDERSSLSPFSDVQRNHSDDSDTMVSTAHFHGGSLRDPSNSKEIVGSSTSVSPGHRASTGVGYIKLLPAVHSSQLPSQEKFALGKSSNYKFHSNTDNFTIPSTTELLNSDPNLSKQFLNVEEMANELDTLLKCIEGPGGFKDASIALLKSSVVPLEEGMWALSERGRMWRDIMDERLGKIQLLLDKTVQVLSRKIYMEGIVKQATDTRYWDLWNRQKLSSELELKQRHISDVHQDLTKQLIELKRHFNTLELNKFGEFGGGQMNRRAFQTKHGPSRHAQSLHSLHNAMSAQLAAADKLSECLSKQMAVLSIESPSVKKDNVKRELFETIGIPYNGTSLISPDEEKTGDTPSRNKLYFSSYAAVAKEQSKRNQSSVMKISEPETVRRRRDSLDRNWASFEPPKTTVKRILLQEDCHKGSASRSSLSMDKQQLNPHLLEGSAIARTEHRATTSTFLYPSKSKGIQDTHTKQSSDSPSPKKPSEISNSNNKEIGLSKSTSGNVKHRPIVAESSSFESGKSHNFPFSPMSAAEDNHTTREILSSSTPRLSISTLSSLPTIDSSPALAFSSPKPTVPTSSSAMSSGSFSTSSKANIKSVSLSRLSASSSPIFSSTLSFQVPENKVPSFTIPPSRNLTSKPPNTEVNKFSLNMENSTIQASAPQPEEVPTGTSSLKLETLVPSRPSSELSTSSQSGSLLSFSGIAIPVSNIALNPKPEQPSAAPFLSSPALSSSGTAPGGKNESSDVVFTQEDEMEEEAPEDNHTTEFTLGNLGGFGIGSAPNPTAAKPNPFGAPFVNTAANPPSSPFTLTVSDGELFRPASFSFQSLQPSQPSQLTNFGAFSGGFGTGNTGQIPTGSRFVQPATTGSGQQALGSVLGAFGQSRQLGAGLPGSGVASASNFGSGFVGNQPAGGFSNAATGGGFAGVASLGGGFASLASAGGGFSGVASAGGGFAAAASATGGFAGAASGSGFSVAGGGFGAFSNQQGSGGFSGFGTSRGTGRPPSEFFTQIRK